LDSLPDNGSIFDQLQLQIDDNSATHNENLGPLAAVEDDELTNLCSDGFVPNIPPNETEHTQLQNLLCPGDVVLTIPSFQNDMPITLVQRIGRAARESSLLGLAIIYTPRDLLDPVTAECNKMMNVPQAASLMEDIPLDLVPNEEWEDIVDAVPRYTDRDLCAFALPVEPETIAKVQQLRIKMYRYIDTIKDTAREVDTKQKTAKRDADRKRVKKQPIDKIEPGIIWFLNTTGCRHQCILEYMRFPDVFEDDKQQS
jgi:hypothetical protein